MDDLGAGLVVLDPMSLRKDKSKFSFPTHLVPCLCYEEESVLCALIAHLREDLLLNLSHLARVDLDEHEHLEKELDVELENLVDLEKELVVDLVVPWPKH